MLFSFVMGVLCVFVGNVLFFGALFVLCLNKRFIKWYTKVMMKQTFNMIDDDFKDIV